jgi:hypothetical protein
MAGSFSRMRVPVAAIRDHDGDGGPIGHILHGPVPGADCLAVRLMWPRAKILLLNLVGKPLKGFLSDLLGSDAKL